MQSPTLYLGNLVTWGSVDYLDGSIENNWSGATMNSFCLNIDNVASFR